MPFLPDEQSTDKLLKRLAIELNNNLDVMELRRIGWFEFRDHDRPETLVATEMAAGAFAYLSLDSDGSWRCNAMVIVAILAFISYYHQAEPRRQDLLRLREILQSSPVNRQALREWFFASFPPVPIRTDQSSGL